MPRNCFPKPRDKEPKVLMVTRNGETINIGIPQNIHPDDRINIEGITLACSAYNSFERALYLVTIDESGIAKKYAVPGTAITQDKEDRSRNVTEKGLSKYLTETHASGTKEHLRYMQIWEGK